MARNRESASDAGLNTPAGQSVHTSMYSSSAGGAGTERSLQRWGGGGDYLQTITTSDEIQEKELNLFTYSNSTSPGCFVRRHHEGRETENPIKSRSSHTLRRPRPSATRSRKDMHAFDSPPLDSSASPFMTSAASLHHDEVKRRQKEARTMCPPRCLSSVTKSNRERDNGDLFPNNYNESKKRLAYGTTMAATYPLHTTSKSVLTTSGKHEKAALWDNNNNNNNNTAAAATTCETDMESPFEDRRFYGTWKLAASQRNIAHLRPLAHQYALGVVHERYAALLEDDSAKQLQKEGEVI